MAKLIVDNSGSVGLAGVLLVFGVALHVGFFARLQSEGRALRFRDRLLTDHADSFLQAPRSLGIWTH